MTETRFEIKDDAIKLDSFLKLADLVMSGGEAKQLIQNGYVQVNGQPETKRGRKLYDGDRVKLDDAGVFIISCNK
ncbi:MAG: RNA-binding S4 domain-containing protein [Trichlorobacter sp.]|nr:RNA-binding S4 domain-containing protein [Trichlorobacter sp.]